MKAIVIILALLFDCAVGYYVLLQEEDLAMLSEQNKELVVSNAQLVQRNTALQALSDRCKDDSAKQLTKRGTK